MTTWVDTADGVRLAVDTRLPEGPAHTAVVVAHGFVASHDHEEVAALADALLEDGHAVVVYDSRGHGRSEGTCTLGDLERRDVAAATELALEHAPRVVLVGASMGAIAVLRHAAGCAPPPAGVVAVSSPAAWRMPWGLHGLCSVALTRTPMGRWFLRRRAGVRVARTWTKPEPPLDLVARIDAPVAFVHGRGDRFIKPSDAVELHRATRDRRRLDLVAGMGHAFDPTGFPAIRAAVGWTLAEDDGARSAERPAPASL